jgi:hypothetical protein
MQNLEKFEHTWLFRWRRSFWRELALKRGSSAVEKNVKPMACEITPELKMLWADSGRSVALYLNGEPWAFLCEGEDDGYSKGILSAKIGNPWREDLFAKTFGRGGG